MSRWLPRVSGQGGGGAVGVLGGDVTGPAAANTVVAIQGSPVSAAAPAPGDVFVWSGAAWVPTPGIAAATLQTAYDAGPDVTQTAADAGIDIDAGTFAAGNITEPILSLSNTQTTPSQNVLSLSFLPTAVPTGGRPLDINVNTNAHSAGRFAIQISNADTGESAAIEYDRINPGSVLTDWFVLPTPTAAATVGVNVDIRGGESGAGATGGELFLRGGLGGAVNDDGGEVHLQGGPDGGGTGVRGGIDFLALGSAGAIPFNETGDEDLSVGFTAVSVIGALNELFSGGGGTTLQDAYDNSGVAQPKILVTAADGPVTLRDAAAPIGDVFVIEDNAGVDFLNVDPAQLNFGPTAGRLFAFNQLSADYGGLTYLPDGKTRTSAAGTQAALQWSSLVVSSVAGGAPFGNDVAPNAITWNGECRFDDSGNLFNSQSLFNQASTITANGVSVGPIYTMINQPTIRTGTLGGAQTCSQHNAVRIQPRWGPNLAGSMTQSSAELVFMTAFVDATVGATSVTTMNYLAAKSVTLTAGGTIGTLTVLDIENITGPTTIRGINSAMATGTFIRHAGVAVSTFAGAIQMANTVPIRFGTAGGNSVNLLRSGAGLLQMIGTGGTNNEGLTWNFDGSANTVAVTSTTGAGLQINTQRVSLGTTTTGSGDWFFIIAPAAVAPPGGTDYATCLNSTGGTVTLGGAYTNVAQWIVNGQSLAGTAPTNAAVVIMRGNVALGTNRYGLLVTSNPTGGTLNYCARFSGAAGVRIDGPLEHTGTTFGLYGTTPVAQSAAYTPTNVTTDRSYDADSTTLDEIADVLGTLIADLQLTGIIG